MTTLSNLRDAAARLACEFTLSMRRLSLARRRLLLGSAMLAAAIALPIRFQGDRVVIG